MFLVVRYLKLVKVICGLCLITFIWVEELYFIVVLTVHDISVSPIVSHLCGVEVSYVATKPKYLES